MEKMEILSKLSEKFVNRKCHNTASMLLNDTVDGTPAEKIQKELLESKFFSMARKHSKSQDATADLVELANFVIDAPAPEAIGEMLVRRIEMMSPSRKVRLREPGEAEITTRGKSYTGRGSRSSYVTLQPEDELESHESWDQNFLEDADWQVATEEAEAVATALKRKTSKTIITKLEGVPAANLNGGEVYDDNTNDQFAFDDVVNMRQSMLSNYVRPNAMVLNPLVTGSLLKEDEFQDSLKYGDFVDKAMGYIGNIFGMDVYESAQVTKTKVLMLDTMNTMLFGVRRYEMMDSYEEVQNGDKTYGVKISTRYDLKEGNAKYMLRCDDAYSTT